MEFQAPKCIAWLFGKNSETTILHFGVFNLVKKNIKCSMVVWEKFRNNNSTFLVFFYKLTPKCSMVVWVRSETTTLHVWFIFVKKNTKCSMVVWKTSETTITFLVSFCNFKPQRSMVVWERTKQQFYILRFLNYLNPRAMLWRGVGYNGTVRGAMVRYDRCDGTVR